MRTVNPSSWRPEKAVGLVAVLALAAAAIAASSANPYTFESASADALRASLTPERLQSCSAVRSPGAGSACRER